MEEYSATHAESFEELGEWPAERFEAAWEAYQVRRTLAEIDGWAMGMKQALYAYGMIGGDGLAKEIESINDHADELRAKVLGSDQPVVEAEYDTSAPYPATAEAEPVGA